MSSFFFTDTHIYDTLVVAPTDWFFARFLHVVLQRLFYVFLFFFCIILIIPLFFCIVEFKTFPFHLLGRVKAELCGFELFPLEGLAFFPLKIHKMIRSGVNPKKKFINF